VEFIIFLTFVVDRSFLRRASSASAPLTTRNSHMNRYGAPDTSPFYNSHTVLSLNDLIELFDQTTICSDYTKTAHKFSICPQRSTARSKSPQLHQVCPQTKMANKSKLKQRAKIMWPFLISMLALFGHGCAVLVHGPFWSFGRAWWCSG